MKLALTVLLLSSALALWGQVYSSGGPVVNNVGQPVAAQIAVCTTQPPLPNPPTTNPPNCSVYAATYTDATLGTPCTLSPSTLGPVSGTGCTNPGKTDSRGNYVIFAPSNVYYLEFYGYGITTYIMPISTYGGPASGTFLSTNGACNAAVATGSDIGAKINSCYTSLGAAGGEILVPASPSCYSYSTPIVLNTNHKSVILRGQGINATCLQYTPTTGIAVLIDTGFTEQPSKIADLWIYGPGASTSATGLKLGGTNDGDQFTIENVKVTFFGTGVLQSGGNTFLAMYLHDIFIDNGQAWKNDAGQENNQFINTTFGLTGLTGGRAAANQVLVTGGTTSFVGCSFDEAQLVTNNTNAQSIVTVSGGHFENPNFSTYPFINFSGNTINLQGVDFLQDNLSTAPAEFIAASGSGAVSIFGGSAYSPTPTGLVNFITGSTLVLTESGFRWLSAVGSGAFYSGAYSGAVNLLPDPWTSTNQLTNLWLNNKAFNVGASNTQFGYDSGTTEWFWTIAGVSQGTIGSGTFAASNNIQAANSVIGKNLTLNGATSGTLMILPQAAAGSPAWTAGTNSGTPAVTATAPLAINSTTGNLTISVSTATSGKAMCWKTATQLGSCSTVPDSSGSCTCN